MTYTKPEVLCVGSALQLVRQHVEKRMHCLDSDGSGKFNATCSAYDADE
jgi:hypothetical protein